MIWGPLPGKMSSHNHYVQQSRKLIDDPHGTGGGMKSGLPSIPTELQDLLYTGTSEEYEGTSSTREGEPVRRFMLIAG